MGVAKELGYTLVKLNSEMKLEEIILWSIYFELSIDEQKAQMRRSGCR
jgi:hypothetical protein